MSPNQLFVLFASGALTSYCSVLLPVSRIWLIAGFGCVIAATTLSLRYPLQHSGLLLLCAATVFFAAEFFSTISYFAALAGVILLPFGFTHLFTEPQHLAKPLAYPASVLLGLSTALLCLDGKRARRNKAADL